MSLCKSVFAATLIFGIAAGPAGAAAATKMVAQDTQGSATVSGTAFDSGGKPLSGVVVTIDGPVRKSVTTDASGTYSFSVPPGLYSIRASHSGYDSAVYGDLIVTAGQNLQSFNIAMSTQTLQSLRTIGVVRTTNTRSIFNPSGLSVATIDSAQIDARVQPNLSRLVAELPGVSASQNSGGRDPNSRWDIRGAGLETKVELDGHVVSSGVFGTYNSVYANSEIFQQVEVLKGAGLNGVNAGESAFGTVNLRTRGFTGKNNVVADGSYDSFFSGRYFFAVEQNLNDRLSVLGALSQQNSLGPDQGVPGPVMSSVGGTTSIGYSGPALIAWQQDLSHPYQTNAQLLKARYKLSSATSITGEFLNLTGRYFSQGASYAYDYGAVPIAQCLNGSTYVAAGGAGCTAASAYGDPRHPLIGTTQQLFSYFPNSSVLNQEPQFSAELRTTLKNDTIFVRPYWTEIKRNIDGSTENLQPGNAGLWYQVVNNANCTAQSATPGAKTIVGGVGAAGPCFSAANDYATPYVNNLSTTVPTYFNTTSTPFTCSPASPCWTTPTQIQRNGQWAYGTPFSQPEFDKDDGVTFSWLHPVAENLYSFNVDFSDDYTTKYTADNSPLPSNCVAVVSGGANKNTPLTSTGAANPFYQPGCNNGGAPFGGTTGSYAYTLPGTATQIPPTHNYKSDISLTALWQINPKLQIGFGNYLTIQHMNYQFTDPNAVALANGLFSSQKDAKGNYISLAGAEPADATLVGGSVTHTHYDPHVQFAYRLNDSISLRGNAGSSITTPYAGLVSGFVKLTPNVNPTTDLLTAPNPQLQPETTVAYDLGLDQRMKDGSVLSVDAFDNVIHNVFVNVSLPATTPAARQAVGIAQTFESQTINGPQQMSYGLEATIQKAPASGFGYYATVTGERAFYYGFSNAFYQQLASSNTKATPVYSGLVNGKQLDGTGGFEDQIPFFKGKFEANYTLPQHKGTGAFGFVWNGSNNPYGTPAFITAYANASYDAGNGLSLGISVENLLNYSQGSFNGQVINNGGFVPWGVYWYKGCGCLINGNANNGPFYNSAVVVPPRNIYLTITKKL